MLSKCLFYGDLLRVKCPEDNPEKRKDHIKKNLSSLKIDSLFWELLILRSGERLKCCERLK